MILWASGPSDYDYIYMFLYPPVSSNVTCWKIQHLHSSMFFSLKPPFIGDFPLPHLITRG